MPKTIDPFYRELGQRIRRFREKKSITQAALGASLKPKVTRASIANLENGSQRVLAHTIAQLAFHLNIAVHEIIPKWQPEAPTIREEQVIQELSKRLSLPAHKLRKLTMNLKLRS